MPDNHKGNRFIKTKKMNVYEFLCLKTLQHLPLLKTVLWQNHRFQRRYSCQILATKSNTVVSEDNDRFLWELPLVKPALTSTKRCDISF